MQACYQYVHLICWPGMACQRRRPSREDPARSPRANAYAERLVLTARSRVTDRILIFGERHLRSVLTGYARHYNGRRPHRSCQLHGFECQIPQVTCRAICTRPGPTIPSPTSRGRNKLRPVRGGLINQYERAA